MLTKEQERQIKMKIKNNRRLKSLFFQIARISLKPDIFEALIRKWYNEFWIDYSVKKILYKEENAEQWMEYRNMYIWYFDMTCIWDKNYDFKKEECQDYYYSIIYWVLDKKCTEKALNVKAILRDEFFGYSFDYWIRNFSKKIVWILFEKMFIYYSNIVKIFNDSFEKKSWNLYIVREWADFFENDFKLKLFQELKYSQAEKYYISSLNKAIKEDFKEEILNEYNKYFDQVQSNLENLILNN